jgi:type II secretory pathway pseudopilin PulG
MTLVELLVSISILMILMAVAARMMNFSVEDRRTREAAREIGVFFGSAQTRAMETGRPCGVMLRQLESQPLCVVGLDQVEVPPPYAGDTLDSVAQVQMPTSPEGLPVFWPDGLRKAVATCSSFSSSLVHVDDLIQFNYQGPFYTIKGPDAQPPPSGDGIVDSATLELGVDLRQGQMLPWPATGLSPAVPYQIIRQPRKSAASGLQLPARAVIDLEASGRDIPSATPEKDYHNYSFSASAGHTEPVIIMYSPTGGIERVYCTYLKNEALNEYDYGPLPVTAPIFLLVGKQERVPSGAAEDTLANWQDLKDLWVTLNPQSGLATIAEVAKGANLLESRQIAREGQGVGGR